MIGVRGIGPLYAVGASLPDHENGSHGEQGERGIGNFACLTPYFADAERRHWPGEETGIIGDGNNNGEKSMAISEQAIEECNPFRGNNILGS